MLPVEDCSLQILHQVLVQSHLNSKEESTEVLPNVHVNFGVACFEGVEAIWQDMIRTCINLQHCLQVLQRKILPDSNMLTSVHINVTCKCVLGPLSFYMPQLTDLYQFIPSKLKSLCYVKSCALCILDSLPNRMQMYTPIS